MSKSLEKNLVLSNFQSEVKDLLQKGSLSSCTHISEMETEGSNPLKSKPFKYL